MSKEPKFKVGDKVLVSFPNIEYVLNSARKYNEQVVEISEVINNDVPLYRIKGYAPLWPDTYFTLVEEEVEIKEITNSEVLNILENEND